MPLAAWRWLESRRGALAQRLWQRAAGGGLWYADLYTVHRPRWGGSATAEQRTFHLERHKASFSNEQAEGRLLPDEAP